MLNSNWFSFYGWGSQQVVHGEILGGSQQHINKIIKFTLKENY